MIRVLAVLILIGLMPDAALAQRQNVRVANPPSDEQQLDGATTARFQLATEYLRGGQFDRAIPLLEDLYLNHPSHAVFSEKLREAYENIKRYQAAIDLIDQLLERGSQDNPTLRVEQARLYFLDGQDQQAIAQWDEVLEAANGAESTYRLVYNSLLRVRLLDRAIDVLLRGRAENIQGVLFQPELAYLYGLTGQFEQAMEEYLELLKASSRQINYVRGRLSRTLDQDGALEAALTVTKRFVAEHPDRPVLRDLLSWLYMEANDYEAAHDHIIVMDRLNGGGGQAIYQFAQRAAEAGAFDTARRAYESVQSEHPDALLGIGQMLELQGQSAPPVESEAYYTAALEAYTTLLTEQPDHAQLADVLMRMAKLHQYSFLDLFAAEAILQRVAIEFAPQPVSQQARLELGRLELERNDLSAAQDIFARLSADRPVNQFTVESQLEAALIDFYSGDFARADAQLAELVEATHEDVANDALSLRLLILENPPQDSAAAALRAYAHVSLLLRQNQTSEAVAHTEEMLTRWARHPVADDVRFLRAQAFRQAQLTHEALAAFGELPLIHPDSPHGDRSLFNYAEILEQDLGDLNAAVEAYTDLLTKFPGSLLINEARERIRSLRSAGV